MSEGKYEKAAVKNGGKGKKSVAVMAAVALILALAVGGTVAYIATKVDPINNQFLPAKVSCEVETNGDTIKVNNTSNIPAYIRAAIVVNWMDGEGNVRGIAPVKDTDYTLTVNTDKWDLVGSFYYYDQSVPEKTQITEALVASYGLMNGVTAPDGYTLTVEVVAEAIQADGVGSDGKTAAESAWGVKLSSGQWTLSNEQQN